MNISNEYQVEVIKYLIDCSYLKEVDLKVKDCYNLTCFDLLYFKIDN